MLSTTLDRLTPRTSPRIRIFLAACFWAAVGGGLLVKSVFLFTQTHAAAPVWPMVACIGLVLGFIKSRLIFDSVARKIVLHIRRKPGPACFGGFLSLKNWGLVIGMGGLGRVLSLFSLPAEAQGAILLLVGSGLLFSSRILWQAHATSPSLCPQSLRKINTPRRNKKRLPLTKQSDR